MSGINAITHKPTRDELKSLRLKVTRLEQSLSKLIKNNQVLASAGLLPYYEQSNEPLVGDNMAIWSDTTDGRLKIKKKINSTGTYDWVRIVKA